AIGLRSWTEPSNSTWIVPRIVSFTSTWRKADFTPARRLASMSKLNLLALTEALWKVLSQASTCFGDTTLARSIASTTCEPASARKMAWSAQPGGNVRGLVRVDRSQVVRRRRSDG